MKQPPLDEDRLQAASTDDIHAALFGQLVSGHAQMALILLGKLAHPETGQPAPASPADAKMFIDQLEMLESRTRGNLGVDEKRILQQALTVTRQAFAELIDRGLDAEDAASFLPQGPGTPASPSTPAADPPG